MTAHSAYRCQDGVQVDVRSYGGVETVVLEFDFAHHGGTISVPNTPVVLWAAATAHRRRLPLVSLVASGGVRVQDGTAALVRLHEIASAFLQLRRAGVPHLLVVRGPITGGVWALFAGSADITIAHRGAQIGFAGSRVRPTATDPGAYTAEAKLESGEVDLVVDPNEEASAISRYVRILARVACRDNTATAPVPVPDVVAGAERLGTGWEAVRLARSPDRPHATAYLDSYFAERVDLRGDRCGGEGEGISAGIGLHDGRPLVYVAQNGTPIGGAGFRTATRLARLAQQWGVGVLTLIDTPGARSDDVAEQDAVGTAIGELLATLNSLTVPVTSLVIGEGTSGGALALAAAGRTWAVPSSYFAVIAPEAAAELLYHDQTRAEDAAEAIRLGPAELRADDVIAGIAGPPDSTA